MCNAVEAPPGARTSLVTARQRHHGSDSGLQRPSAPPPKSCHVLISTGSRPTPSTVLPWFFRGLPCRGGHRRSRPGRISCRPLVTARQRHHQSDSGLQRPSAPPPKSCHVLISTGSRPTPSTVLPWFFRGLPCRGGHRRSRPGRISCRPLGCLTPIGATTKVLPRAHPHWPPPRTQHCPVPSLPWDSVPGRLPPQPAWPHLMSASVIVLGPLPDPADEDQRVQW